MKKGFRSSFAKLAGIAAGALAAGGCAKAPYQTQTFEHRYNGTNANGDAPHNTALFENRYGAPVPQQGPQAPGPAYYAPPGGAGLLACAQSFECASTLPANRQPAAFRMISEQEKCNARFGNSKHTAGDESDWRACRASAMASFTDAMNRVNDQEAQAAERARAAAARDQAQIDKERRQYEPVAAVPLTDEQADAARKAVCQKTQQEIIMSRRSANPQQAEFLMLNCRPDEIMVPLPPLPPR